MTVRLEGAQITVRFHVPETPLVLDTTSVVDPGNFGFEYTDSSPTPPRIRKVSLVDEDTIRIELDAAPTAAAKFVRYAYRQAGSVQRTEDGRARQSTRLRRHAIALRQPAAQLVRAVQLANPLTRTTREQRRESAQGC
ncbi:MAG: hypothetical protein H6837_12955 [Planctomycetes bacterium]|nr:hypothetical protein [Planctomycetota bacterium]